MITSLTSIFFGLVLTILIVACILILLGLFVGAHNLTQEYLRHNAQRAADLAAIRRKREEKP